MRTFMFYWRLYLYFLLDYTVDLAESKSILTTFITH